MTSRDVPDDDLAQQWHDIRTTTARLHRLLDADLEAAGVPPQWYPVLELLLLAEGHRMAMSTLARELTMTSGGFSKLADRMAAEGLIDRRGTTDDRRVVHATLTDAGLELAQTARAAYVTALRQRLQRVESLAVVAEAMRALGATEAALPAEPVAEPGLEHLADERDPALPDRRGRGRRSGGSAH